MATVLARPRADDSFEIHEDARTEETELMIEDDADRAANDVAGAAATDDMMGQAEEELEEEEPGEEEDEGEEMSDDEQVESSVQADMNKLVIDFPEFRGKYRLIKRIGEGRLQLASFASSWDG